MSDAPERIFIAETLSGMIAIAGEPPAWATSPSYRRADLPPTLTQALAVPEVKALVEAAQAYRSARDSIKRASDLQAVIEASNKALAEFMAALRAVESA